MRTLEVNRAIDLSPLHTFASQHQAACAIDLSSVNQIDALVEILRTLPKPVRVLGGGSNVVFVSDYSGTLVLNKLLGRTCLKTDASRSVQLWRLGAGESWHQWVRFSVSAGLSGLENLALIPGTVGAAPIQNIGAYGVELSSVCRGVMARELSSGRSHYFSVEACCFGYRDSIFKSPELANRWLITAVDFELSECFKPQLSYPALQARCQGPITAQTVFDAVCAIRSEKLPDPADTPNAGSFFKNPIVPQALATACLKTLPQLPVYPVDEHSVKLSAAYLIEAVGLKGAVLEEVGVYHKHALVLVRLAQGSGVAILALAQLIQARVLAAFNVSLEIEPQVWGV